MNSSMKKAISCILMTVLYGAISCILMTVLYGLYSVHKQHSEDLHARPDRCSNCFIPNYSYVIENKNICKRSSPDQHIDIIILIFTTHSRKVDRDALRNTWLTFSKNNTGTIRYAFLLGETPNYKLRSDVESENKKYNDILKQSFLDDYQNLTLKTVMALSYATENCAHAKFFMKVDDDYYVNVPNLMTTLRDKSEVLRTAVGGEALIRTRPVRSKRHKYYASVHMYPNNTYPDYIRGAYATRMAAAKDILRTSRDTPFFHMEDVYVGLCLRNLGYRVHHIRGFQKYDRLPVCHCYYRDYAIAQHLSRHNDITNIWNSRCSWMCAGYGYVLVISLLLIIFVICLANKQTL